MNGKNKLLTVVIVSWNSRQQTAECLRSVYSIRDYSELKEKLEVIVIDNASSDGTSEAIRNSFPDVILKINSENRGYAPACNQGMRSASGRYVLLLGSDTVLADNTLLHCLEFLENNPRCAAAGCRLIYPDGRLQGNCKKFPSLKNAFYTYLSLDRLNYDYDMLWFNYDRDLEVDQIATTFLMIRSDVLGNIGYFDERYKIMYNDVDLCKRIRGAGYSIFFLKDAVAVHHGSLSTGKAGFRVRRIMYSDIFRYYRSNFGLPSYLLLPVLVFRLFVVSVLK